MDAQFVHPASRHAPHAPEGLDGQPGDEGLRTVGMDRAQPIGLAVVGGDLRQKFVVGNAGRGYQRDLFADSPLDRPRHVHAQLDARLVPRDVQKSLVVGDGFDQIGEFVENAVYPGRHFLVNLHASGNEDQVGAQLPGPERGHGRTDAVAPRLVAGRRDHAPSFGSSHHDGLAAVLRVVALFDRGVEGVHVDMYDLAFVHRVTMIVGCCRGDSPDLFPFEFRASLRSAAARVVFRRTRAAGRRDRRGDVLPGPRRRVLYPRRSRKCSRTVSQGIGPDVKRTAGFRDENLSAVSLRGVGSSGSFPSFRSGSVRRRSATASRRVPARRDNGPNGGRRAGCPRRADGPGALRRP